MADFATYVESIKNNVDWQGLEQALGALAHEALIPVLEGEAADLKSFGYEIGKDMVAAILQANQDWQFKLKGQLKLLAEIGRVRTNGASWDFASQALSLVFRAAVAGLTGAAGKLIP